MSLLLPGLQRKKIVGPGILYCNMYKIQLMVQYSSKFLTLKTETRYLFQKLKKTKKNFSFKENLEQVSEATQATGARSQNDYINTKQKKNT